MADRQLRKGLAALLTANGDSRLSQGSPQNLLPGMLKRDPNTRLRRLLCSEV